MSVETTSSSPPVKKRTFLRRRLPFVILGFALLAGLTVWFWPGESLEPAQRNFSLIMLTQLTVLLILLWLIGFSGFRWMVRLGILAMVIGLPLVAVRQVRFSGGMAPSFEFRWDPTHDDVLEAHRKGRDQPARPVEVKAVAGSSDYPEYRGPKRDGIVDSPRLDWSQERPRMLWRQPIGGGYASFAVVGNMAVTIEQRRDKEAVVAYHTDDGSELWVHDYPAHFKEVLGGPGPRATPTIVGGSVYSLGAAGHLVCLDAATGKPHWSVDILKDNSNVMWGMSGSPLVYDRVVVVNPGTQTAAAAGRAVVAYDRATGTEVWAAGNTRAGYASPMLASLHGKQQVLIFDGEEIAGYDASHGTKLWAWPWITQQGINVAQPLVLDGDRVFVSSSYGVGCAMLKVSENDGSKWAATPLWGDPPKKTMRCKLSSPVYYQGHIYGLSEEYLACIDAETGEQKWRGSVRYGHGQLLLANGRLVILSEAGKLLLVDASPRTDRSRRGAFQAIEGKTWNYPALADGRIYVRNHLEMAAYDLRVEERARELRQP
jgi:outer membrane protein assembly factor BamB